MKHRVEKILYLMDNEDICNKLGENSSKIEETRNTANIVNIWKKMINE